MNLRSVDLNLLVILDALLDEAHVSRAAERIGLSQPAVSSALERCRHLFRDRLLERRKGGMALTPKAQALRLPVKDVLAQLTVLIDPPQPDLATLRQIVRNSMADLPAALLASALHGKLAASAPGLTLAILPWLGARQALDELARGAVDLAVSVFPTVETGFTRTELLREHYLVAMRRGHPAAAEFGLECWLAYPHVLVSGRGETYGALDEALAARGLSRRIAMVVPSFLIVPSLLLASDLIALLPSRAITGEMADRLACFEPPLAVSGFSLHAARHRRSEHDAAVRHVEGLIVEELRAGQG